MGDYNYLQAYVLYIDNEPATAFDAGAVDDADCKYLGVIKEGAGYKLSKDEKLNESTGSELVLSWKNEVQAEILTKLTDADKAAIDGKTASLLFLPIDGVTIPDDATPLTTNLNSSGVVLPSGASGTMTAPMKLNIEEDEKYGSGKVSPITLKGELSAASKDKLRKTVTINDTV